MSMETGTSIDAEIEAASKAFESFCPEEFLSYINQLFSIEKKRIREHKLLGKPEPFSFAYQKKSAAMNRVLRKRSQEIEGESPEERRGRMAERKQYMWTYAYWWNRTHMLEAMAKSRVGNIEEKKNIERGAQTLLKLLSGESNEEQIHPAFRRLLGKLNKMDMAMPVPDAPHSEALLQKGD